MTDRWNWRIAFIAANEMTNKFRNMVATNMNFTSVFDLSPTEKLQLVEDLSDDLAATPEAVPVRDWQKQEFACRKANLLRNPATGLSWEEVKRRVRSRYGRLERLRREVNFGLEEIKLGEVVEVDLEDIFNEDEK